MPPFLTDDRNSVTLEKRQRFVGSVNWYISFGTASYLCGVSWERPYLCCILVHKSRTLKKRQRFVGSLNRYISFETEPYLCGVAWEKALFLLNYFAQKSYSRKEAMATICRFSKVVDLFWTRPYFCWTFVQELFLVGLLFGGFFVNESCSRKPYGIVNSCRIAGLLRVFLKREYLLKNSSLSWVSFGTQINSINFCWALLQKSS